MPASRNSLDQRAISSPADLNFPQLLLQQGAECSGSSGFSFISDCCPSLSPRREKSGLKTNQKARQNPKALAQLDGYKRGLVNSLTGNLQWFGFERVAKVETLQEIIDEMSEGDGKSF